MRYCLWGSILLAAALPLGCENDSDTVSDPEQGQTQDFFIQITNAEGDEVISGEIGGALIRITGADVAESATSDANSERLQFEVSQNSTSGDVSILVLEDENDCQDGRVAVLCTKAGSAAPELEILMLCSVEDEELDPILYAAIAVSQD